MKNIQNPLKHKKTLKDKVIDNLPIQKKPNKKAQCFIWGLRLLLYIAFFLAGYITAKLQMLFTLSQ